MRDRVTPLLSEAQIRVRVQELGAQLTRDYAGKDLVVIGLLNGGIFPILERELKAGNSPVIILHPYELVRPAAFLRRMLPDVASHPALFPFTLTKTGFLKKLLQNFPVSPLATYLDEVTAHV